jgi:hypothetical protein
MLRRGLIVLAGLLALGACDSTDPASETRLSILLTDAPGDVSQAVVTIESIELVGGPGGPLALEDAQLPWTGDLTTLANDFTILVDEASVPSGTYGQLRLILAPEACIGVETDGPDDDVFETPNAAAALGVEYCDGVPAGALQMPSLAETGIKVVFQGAIDVTGDQQVLLLDFIVAESYGKLAGESGTWVMTPVVHGVDFDLTGSVALTVLDPDDLLGADGLTFEDLTAELDGEATVLAADGTATFALQEPGSYTLALTGVTDITTDPALPLDITIQRGQQSSVTLTIAAVTP